MFCWVRLPQQVRMTSAAFWPTPTGTWWTGRRSRRGTKPRKRCTGESDGDWTGSWSEPGSDACFRRSLHPGDLFPFTRKPLFIIVDSSNSTAYKVGGPAGSGRVLVLSGPVLILLCSIRSELLQPVRPAAGVSAVPDRLPKERPGWVSASVCCRVLQARCSRFSLWFWFRSRSVSARQPLHALLVLSSAGLLLRLRPEQPAAWPVGERAGLPEEGVPGHRPDADPIPEHR